MSWERPHILSGKEFFARAVALGGDQSAKLGPHGFGQIVAVVDLHNVGSAALAGLAVDADKLLLFGTLFCFLLLFVSLIHYKSLHFHKIQPLTQMMSQSFRVLTVLP